MTIVPANRLSLTGWKLTLPTGAAPLPGQTYGVPTEIRQPQLAQYADGNFRVYGYGVVFTAPVAGINQNGSKYPRCELREATADGTGLASWNPAVGRHTLTVLHQISKLPVKKPEVVIAQVHDSTFSYVLLIRARGNPDGTVTIFARPINAATNTDGADVILNPAYKLGDLWQSQIVAEQGHITVPGTALDLPWSSTGCYFKVGCYTQSNLTTVAGEDPAAVGEVLVRSIAVTHEP